MNLLRQCRYKEFTDGKKTDPSINDYMFKANKSDIYNICNYLNSVVVLIACAGFSEDVINPDNGSVGIPDIITDGIWVWTGDLPYYVEKYELELPKEFLDTMKKNNWKVNLSIDDIDLENITIDCVHIFKE